MAKGEIIPYFASQFRAGLKGTDIVRIYENLHKGIWPHNGYFNLVDSWSIAAPKDHRPADDFTAVTRREATSLGRSSQPRLPRTPARNSSSVCGLRPVTVR